MVNIEYIRNSFIDKLKREEFVIDKSGVKLLEMTGVSFIADEPTIFGAVNEEYIGKELAWYLSGSLSVHAIEAPVPKIWLDVSDINGMINSNYGYLVFSRENGCQYDNVLNELKARPTSRQAVMIYTRPSIHIDSKTNGMNDFICTNAVQYLIRDRVLHAIVQMRSNDVVYGYRNDFAWAQFILNRLAADLGINTGTITWQVGSLHVYERHFSLIK